MRQSPRTLPSGIEPHADTLELPDDLTTRLLPEGKDPARAALELLAVEGYRTERLSEHQVRVMLDYETRMEVHALLKEHDVYLHYSVEDLEQDNRTASFLRSLRAQETLQRVG